MQQATTALSLCLRSMDRGLTSSEVKLATWLIAAAWKLGTAPVEFSLREIQQGCMRGDVAFPGWGAHYRTINAALAGLVAKGIVDVAEGKPTGFGHTSKIFTLTNAVA